MLRLAEVAHYTFFMLPAVLLLLSKTNAKSKS
jgi:hypothetical protein